MPVFGAKSGMAIFQMGYFKGASDQLADDCGKLFRSTFFKPQLIF